MRPVRVLLAILAALLALVAVLVGLALATEYRPAPEEPAEADCERDGAPLRAGQPFTVLSWNLQYAGSRKHHFFYDGGRAVSVPEADVRATLDAIGAVLEEVGPDLALLQEVDRNSRRTHFIDELPPLVQAAGAACWAAAPYHRSPYVPAPSHEPMGRVDLELALLSRAPMRHAVRHQLPLLDEPWYRKVFNLKRAVLTAEVPVEGLDQPLAVAVTHLSAFSHGDGTLSRQVDALDAWIAARPPGQPWILAGDMNMLPPGDDPKRLSAESDLYADADNPIERLFARYSEVFSDQLDPANRTYLPFGAAEPDRKIDYIFHGGPIRVVEARVMREHADISDHLPLVARFAVGEAAVPGAAAAGDEGAEVPADAPADGAPPAPGDP